MQREEVLIKCWINILIIIMSYSNQNYFSKAICITNFDLNVEIAPVQQVVLSSSRHWLNGNVHKQKQAAISPSQNEAPVFSTTVLRQIWFQCWLVQCPRHDPGPGYRAQKQAARSRLAHRVETPLSHWRHIEKTDTQNYGINTKE